VNREAQEEELKSPLVALVASGLFCGLRILGCAIIVQPELKLFPELSQGILSIDILDR
tara:strand:+ start:2011 stop:2184 length:174 start_codon:yes stop_codon:yes gene_type:complete